MKKTTRSAALLLSALASLPAVSFALNPVIQTMYTGRSGIGHRGNATGRAAPLGAVTF